MVTARINAIHSSVPAAVSQEELWESRFAGVPTRPGSARLWARAGVGTRHAVVDPRREDISGWSTAKRMDRYMAEALPLACDATQGALRSAGMTARDVDIVSVVSCTGYGAPGIDIQLARELGMSSALQRLVVGHMGCYAAVPALATATDAAVARNLTSIVLCIELSSLHVQPLDEAPDQLVVHSLFGDAVVAAVVSPSGDGFEPIDVVASSDPRHLDDMRWDITDHGFRMTLSSRVPEHLAAHLAPTIERLLGPAGLSRSNVRGWAIHPGGPRILDVCARELGLDDDALRQSRSVLHDFGNCSSATLLLVLDRLAKHAGLRSGDAVVAMAFGPGLTLYASLLRWSGATAART